MTLRKVFYRLLFSLPFLAAIFFVHGFHAEFVNNAQVHWQYVRDNEGKVYLALDVFSPSGIKVTRMDANGRDAADRWELVNAPLWFAGKSRFPQMGKFQDALPLYLPHPPASDVLYSFGWYTFLYEWKGSSPLPAESALRIRYKNIGTDAVYVARHIQQAKVTSTIALSDDNEPIIHLNFFYPVSAWSRYANPREPLIKGMNLTANDAPGTFRLADKNQRDYQVILEDEITRDADILSGILRGEGRGLTQIYKKDIKAAPPPKMPWGEMLAAWIRHAAAVVIILYLAYIFWWVGFALVRIARWDLDGAAEKIVIPVFCGIIALTVLFFIVGLLKLLYFSVVVVILSLFLALSLRDGGHFRRLGILLKDTVRQIWDQPWRVIFLGVLGYFFYHMLTYCFIPVTFIDGSADIQNSVLPILNSYRIRHSFQAPTQNSTYGLISQALDVLRAVANILSGEPGVYLMSVFYVGLIFGAVYLIGKRIFAIHNLLIYLAVLAAGSFILFTEGFHLGKNQTAAMAFLLISLYSTRYHRHPRNFVLPALFFGFISAQYLHFAAIFFVYLFLISLPFLGGTEKAGRSVWARHLLSLEIFIIFPAMFCGKLILETGTCFPPGSTPPWLSNFFLSRNQDNPLYRYIDNNYIRNFYALHQLANFGRKMSLMDLLAKLGNLKDTINSIFLLLFIPFLKDFNHAKKLFVLLTGVLVVLMTAVFPEAPRLRVFFVYPVIIIQFAVMASLLHYIFNFPFIRHDKVRKFFAWAVSLGMIGFILFGKDPFFPMPSFLHKITTLSHHNRRPDIRAVFGGRETPYQYMKTIVTGVDMFEGMPNPANNHFDYGLLVRAYTQPDDVILMIPTRFHSYTNRLLTSQHDWGSVIYQRDVNKIMRDLQKLNIRYLSVMPVNFVDYNPYYSPIFDRDVFRKYFQLVFAYKRSRLYKIIYDGSCQEKTPSPLVLEGLPFLPMEDEGDESPATPELGDDRR